MSSFLESASLSEARVYEKHMEKFIAQESRPCFHLSPRVGWMNDPNGFSYYKGQYHLFYQYNPYATVWAPMHWGHAVSDDLLTWKHLPAALAPDAPYDDKEGCFSGSAIEMPDGRHLLMYTGVSANGHHTDGTVKTKQTQCIALGDGVDYVKLDCNPVIDASSLPKGSSSIDFRDPKIWREDDGTYRAVIASRDANGSGQIVMYKSDDAIKWEFVSVLARNNGRWGYMWECPDLFELDGYDVLLLSPQDMLPEGHEFYSGNGTLCLIGHVDKETGELIEQSATNIDHGIDFYATQTLLTPDGRRVMVAWMQNWDSIAGAAPSMRWFGQMTVPRELSVREGRLYQWPVRELEAHRGQKVLHKDVRLGGDPVVLDGVKGRVVDLLVDVRPTDDDYPYQEFVIWFARDDKFHCSLRYRPATGRLVMSRIHAGSRRAFVHHRKCDVDGAPTHLSLRLVMDRHSVEVFVNEGRLTLTMTIPTDLSADMISFFSRGFVTLDVEKYDLS
ncbi:MAG: glycoside hydrolase family 32 protein [Coriobacteriales bacterium]|nr:glycoside hydrolase family 32 protein [Coriobacteriales bacterium]